MPAREIVKTALIVQRNCLLDRPPEIGKFLGAQRFNILSYLKPGGRRIRRDRAVIVNSLLPLGLTAISVLLAGSGDKDRGRP